MITKILDREIDDYTKNNGYKPKNLILGAKQYYKLIDECRDNFNTLDPLCRYYKGILLEIINYKKSNDIANNLIILE